MKIGGKKVLTLDKGEKINFKSQDTIINLSINKILKFRKYNIFSPYDQEKKEEMKSSISENGILEPIIVRNIEDGFYEILAGHNRVQCAEELGIKEIPAKVIECDDIRATLIMLDTNLCNREKILPVDKGHAYKLRNKILKEMKNNDEIFPEEMDKSKTQIFRYIRLTELIRPLQEKVNKELMTIKVGTELSFLSKEKQYILNFVLDNENLSINLEQAQKVRALGYNLNYDAVISILNNKDKDNKFTGKLNRAIVKKYRNKFANDEEFGILIDKLLEDYFK